MKWWRSPSWGRRKGRWIRGRSRLPRLRCAVLRTSVRLGFRSAGSARWRLSSAGNWRSLEFARCWREPWPNWCRRASWGCLREGKEGKNGGKETGRGISSCGEGRAVHFEKNEIAAEGGAGSRLGARFVRGRVLQFDQDSVCGDSEFSTFDGDRARGAIGYRESERSGSGRDAGSRASVRGIFGAAGGVPDSRFCADGGSSDDSDECGRRN